MIGIDNNNIAQTSSETPQTKTLKDKLVDKALETIQLIVKDTENRLTNYQKDSSLLKEGVFYANDYFLALKKINNLFLLNFMRDQGHFFHGIAPKNYFNIEKDENSLTGHSVQDYVLCKDQSPSEALTALRKGLTFLACGEACLISYYEAIRTVLEKEKFDAIFAADSPTPFRIRDNDANPIKQLIQPKYTDSPAAIKKGQIVFVKGVPTYSFKHLNGEGMNFHALCLSDTPAKQTFLGLGLNPEGATFNDIAKVLMDEFNKTPIGTAILTDELATKFLKELCHPQSVKLSEVLKEYKVTFKEFTHVGGGTCFSYVGDFHEERISQLVQANIFEAKELMVKWKEEEIQKSKLEHSSRPQAHSK